MLIESYSKAKNLTIKTLFLILTLSASITGFANQVKCGNNDQAQRLAQLIKADQEQQRASLNCSAKLNEIALIKARMLLKNEIIWHDVGHLTPNQLLRHHDFKLPSTYTLFGNQVEAIAGGVGQVDSTFKDFKNSPPHRDLLLGQNEFFAAQNQMGVAYLEQANSEHQHYWVVIIADERNQTKQPSTLTAVEPPLDTNNNRYRKRAVKERMHRNRVKDRLYPNKNQ